MPRFGNFKALLLSFALLPAFAFTSSAQTEQRAELIIPSTQQEQRVADRTKLYCAGYIRYQTLPHMPEIVGALEEHEQRRYADRDVVYINAGSKQGIQEGQTFQIIRPRGDMKGVHKEKKGFLGTYIQEIGQLRVFKVRGDTSAAQIIFTCDEALLGDLVAPVPDRVSPLERSAGILDVFADPTGKQTGRLMMAKDNREMVTKNEVVYIDLGSEDQVKTGDYLTIYRPLGTGNINRRDGEEMGPNRDPGFSSHSYSGGGIGSMANRANDKNGDGRYSDKPISSREVKQHRPLMPRKIVGEMVIIDVQTRTATAIITRVAGEVHTGDWVEIQ
ncbi:MAG TPA: hypothetical protein VE980_05025 [Pyrinomonadaceae bacterium]|nr:hypothetical protein [Pyrinomonadaceae bacterium]